ncbi:hypothetical protein [Actinoplanes sp. NPDC023714]|uniref:hypothetical protein n=1 Tax=Actinoplanes sp. NPDC023714 TaxID=3154322 RepID=UPI0033D38C65
MAALMLVPGVLAPVWAPSPAWASGTVSAQSFDQAAEDLIYVRYLAGYDPRALVRTAAWNALAPAKPEQVPALVARFLSSGLPYAVGRAEQLAARNADFARRVLATHTAEYAPEVHAAAQFALANGTSALEAFARTGYAAAMQRDRTAREAAGEQAAALLQSDREYVAHLRDHDPGPQVRAAAGLALRAEATDADLVEFYAYDWAAAAAVDLTTLKTQCINGDMKWRAAVKTLLPAAIAAQEAANKAEGEAKALAKEQALRAWKKVTAEASPAKSTWESAAEVAHLQAENWAAVAQAAAESADNPNWESIGNSAQANAQQWATEQTNAAGQAAYWTNLYEQALAGELAMQP